MTAPATSFPMAMLVRLAAVPAVGVIHSVDNWRMFGYPGIPKYFTFFGRLFGGRRPKAQVFLSREMPVLVLHAESKWAVSRFGPEVAAAFMAQVVEDLFPVEPSKTNLLHLGMSLSSAQEARKHLEIGIARYCLNSPAEALQVFERRTQGAVDPPDWPRLMMGGATFMTSPDSIFSTFALKMELILEGKAVEDDPCPENPARTEFLAIHMRKLAAYPGMSKESDAGA